ncbi:MAG: flagellin [Nanoarchaeota archaeon]
MALVINTNVSSLIAQRNLQFNTMNLNRSFEKLASGYRINKAADDAAGLSISETLRTQIRGTRQAIANTQDGVNMLAIGEGAFTTISENLQRIRELTIQAANDTNATVERSAIALEVSERLKDINRIAYTTRGSNVFLLDGNLNSFYLQIGANSTLSTNALDISDVFSSSYCTALGISQNITTSVHATGGGIYESGGSCRSFLDVIDFAISQVADRRAKLGALQNRLESTVQNLSISVENLLTTESRIRNLDIASESAELTKNQILQQSAISVLAQANQAPTLALQLLQ